MKLICMKKFLGIYFFFIPFYAISQSLTPIEDEETHKIGFLNEKGDTVVPFVYDKVHMLYHYEFRNGICKVAKKDSGFGYIDTMGKEFIPCKYAYLGDESEGLIGAIPYEGSFSHANKYLNRNGEIVLDSIYAWPHDFHSGLAVCRSSNGKYGYINKNGVWVIPPIYDYAYGFKDGFAKVSILPENFNGNYITDIPYFYIDTKGEKIILPK